VPLPGSGYAVLLVEDHPLNVELVRDLLESEGIAVEQVPSAEEALAKVAREPPDLVLLDLALPGMDGLEATRRLKGDPATRDVCVVVLTARAMTSDRDAAMARGADAFMTKPLDTRNFPREILALLRARGAPRRPPRSADPADPGEDADR
jgi:two-component system cell cycle response regulator DivK